MNNWQEFREAGLLWWVNRALHLFGWAIVVTVDDNNEVTSALPMKVPYRGFEVGSEERGFKRLTQHLADNMPVLLENVKDCNE